MEQATPNKDEDEIASKFPRSRPIAIFSGTEGLRVAVWKNQLKEGDNYSIRIDRSYKNENQEERSTSYLRESDLLRSIRLFERADDWIEQDRAKQRISPTITR